MNGANKKMNPDSRTSDLNGSLARESPDSIFTINPERGGTMAPNPAKEKAMSITIIQRNVVLVTERQDSLIATLSQSAKQPWLAGQNRPLSDAPVLGIGGPVAEAISWALTRLHYAQLEVHLAFLREFQIGHTLAAYMCNKEGPSTRYSSPCTPEGEAAAVAAGFTHLAVESEENRHMPNISFTPRKPGIHVLTRFSAPGATLRQDTEVGQGFWVIHNTAWGQWGGTPRALVRMATERLARKTGHEARDCTQAVHAGIQTCYEEWQEVRDRHYPRPAEGHKAPARPLGLTGEDLFEYIEEELRRRR